MKDIMREVFASMRNNKMRIALTGFSIGWGLFILIVILGAGNGLVNGIIKNFGTDVDHVVRLTPGKTQMDYAGFSKGREIHLQAEDIEFLRKRLPDKIAEVHTQVSSPILETIYNDKILKTNVVGVAPGFMPREEYSLVKGREILQQDLNAHRKVCLISVFTQRFFFKEKQEVIGEWIGINGIMFQIVGVYRTKIESQKTHTLFAPQTTVIDTYVPSGNLSKVTLVAKNVKTHEENVQYMNDIYQTLGERLQFNPADRSAIKNKSFFEQFSQLMGILSIVQVFIWIVGIATLLGGVVGVSNIMLITVKERTRELGVRRAMGASSFSIIRLVLIESVIITVIFGYIGMIIGVGITQFASWAITAMGGSDIFDNPTVSLGVVFSANAIMILAGIVAGYIPAKRAVSIKLVDSLSS